MRPTCGCSFIIFPRCLHGICEIEFSHMGKTTRNPDLVNKNIRIYHECEGRIEKSVAIWHHEACRVMTNGDPGGQIFLSYPHTYNGLFLMLTTVLYLKISFQKSLNTLRYNFT